MCFCLIKLESGVSVKCLFICVTLKLSKLSVSEGKSLTRTDTLDTNASDSSLITNKYLSDGRLINGIEDMFKLPTPIDLIRHNFFEELTIKPKDFDENDAIYFRAGF